MKLIDAIKKYFRRKAATQTPQQDGQVVEPVPLRIENTKPAQITPEPDDAELAAQALLESMCDVRSKMKDVRDAAADAHQPSSISHQKAISQFPLTRLPVAFQPSAIIHQNTTTPWPTASAPPAPPRHGW